MFLKGITFTFLEKSQCRILIDLKKEWSKKIINNKNLDLFDV